jgi:PD-(D/E)XK nuclease superfamily
VYAETLAAWAKLAGSTARGPSTEVLLESLRQMVDAASRDAVFATQRLNGLFAQIGALFPGVGDPLNRKLNISSNRWLAQSNENSYSDWLAWIIERQDDSSQVLSLFGIIARLHADTRWTVEREVVTPYGRLDLLLRNPQLGVLCIEVKTESVPGPDQLERYRNWLAGQRFQMAWFSWLPKRRRMTHLPRNTISVPGNISP